MMQVTGTKDDYKVWYSFQPARLNPKDGTPAKRTWLTEDRIEGGIKVPVNLPLEVLGTEAEDTITGFSGTVTSIIMHHSGCLHLELQPKGANTETGEMRPAYDFDIRLLKGKAIPKLTEVEKKKSQQEKPSPGPFESVRPRTTP